MHAFYSQYLRLLSLCACIYVYICTYARVYVCVRRSLTLCVRASQVFWRLCVSEERGKPFGSVPAAVRARRGHGLKLPYAA